MSVADAPHLDAAATEALLQLALASGAMAAWEKSASDGTVAWYESSHPEWATALGSPLSDWLNAIDGQSWQAAASSTGTARHPREAYRREFQIVAEDGRSQWVEARAFSLGEGAHRRWVGIVAELTERRCEFPAAFIHALRNPLTAVLSSAQLLRRHGQDRADLLDSAARSIERQVEHLSHLLGEISEWSRIRQTQAEPPMEILDLRAIAIHAERTYRPLLEARQLALSVELPENPLYVRGGSARLAEAVGKLLLNAAKFTPEGGNIRVELVAEDCQATIRVRDGGVGIDPAVLHRVFDPLFQHAAPLHPGHTGLGLGLALAKRWVEDLGGEITAWSAGKGHGSEFVIRLPLAGESRPC